MKLPGPGLAVVVTAYTQINADETKTYRSKVQGFRFQTTWFIVIGVYRRPSASIGG
jgi:hypothetical protein